MRGRLPCITDVKRVRGKRVIVRASLDVPMKEGNIENHFRILKAVPTLLHLVNAGAKVIVITHMGRDPKTALAPLHSILKEHLDIAYVPALIGDEVDTALASLLEGGVLLLENLRSHKGETENDPDFAKKLASYADIYVNDAFAVSHREHASIVGIPSYIKGYAGINFREEYEGLRKALTPKKPSLFILGGAKFETKEPLVKKYLKKYDHIFLGGALANDFLKAQGYEVGKSLVSDLDLSKSPLKKNRRILLPVDVVAVDGTNVRVANVDAVTKAERILDIGPKSVEMLGKHIKKAKTILWNGPVGNYEGGFATGTKDCALHIAESKAHSVVGGGDTIAAIETLAINDKFGFLSTAGGAMLSFLENKTLPGIEALVKKKKKNGRAR